MLPRLKKQAMFLKVAKILSIKIFRVLENGYENYFVTVA
jgi:hypothetical protein